MIGLLEHLLRGAGAVLLERRSGPLRYAQKSSQADLVTDADRASEEFILERLGRAAPHDGTLSEESGYHPTTGERTWVIDPLDGTTNYVAGLPDFGVIIGVVEGGRGIAGGMYLPTDDLLYLAEDGKGATRNSVPLRVSATDELQHAIFDHSLANLPDAAALDRQWHTLQQLVSVARAVRCSQSLRYLARVADASYDGFVYHSVGLWDICGPSVILREAGGTITDFCGAELDVSPSGPFAQNPFNTALGGNPMLARELVRLFDR